MNICLVCGKETKNKMFCSRDCRTKYQTHEKGKCLNCGKILTRCEVKYCSKKCYNEYKHKKFLENIQYNRCIICGVETINQKYCSQKCMAKDESRKIIAKKNLETINKNNHEWTEEDKELLINEYGITPINELADKIGVSQGALIVKARYFDIKSKRMWTNDEIEYLKIHKDEDIVLISEVLNKSISSIMKKYGRLNGFLGEHNESLIKPQDYIYNFVKNELKVPCLNEVPLGNRFVSDILVASILDIEVQGSYWHKDSRIIAPSEETKKIIDKDIRKKQYLETIGIEVLYVNEIDLFQNPDKQKRRIKEKLIEKDILRELPN